ncbi:hypothetical protein DSO57_1004884 [Entomophthora muscae]|uniref:Uncharacterized protein n=1 Tax=Entomophthora muscae TaxID=34485 RepID=A0ACC2TVR9_9FUNG|nr:hypothetical protein DSO57_1004884 [Entomophthora muscae]
MTRWQEWRDLVILSVSGGEQVWNMAGLGLRRPTPEKTRILPKVPENVETDFKSDLLECQKKEDLCPGVGHCSSRQNVFEPKVHNSIISQNDNGV